MSEMSELNKVVDWGQRLALLDAYNLSEKTAAKIFGTTVKEIKTARGTVEVDSSFDVSLFKKEIEGLNKSGKNGEAKAVKTPGKIIQAFTEMPSEPTPLDAFQKKYGGVSRHVLRQSKRFDTSGTPGRIRIKEIEGVDHIWRDNSATAV